MVASTFHDLKTVSQPTLDVLQQLNLTTPTPVQTVVIPLFTGHQDVAVEACTGSGKTLSFVIPVTERLRSLEEALLPHQVGFIIVSPTRELAGQIHNVAQPFLNSVPGVSSLLLVGGTDPAADAKEFAARGAQVLIGTPGRLLDVMQRSSLMTLKRFEVLVLDEADRLLDMGFRVQLDSIMKMLPKQRRTGLFSATQTEAVEQLARAGLRNAVKVCVDVAESNTHSQQHQQQQHKHSAQMPQPASMQRTPSSLQIEYQTCDHIQKVQQLVSLIQEHCNEKVIVYFLTCASVDFFSAALTQLPQMASARLHALHGKMKQQAREATMTAYSTGTAGCLLCTDVAARGLDIPDVQYIIQYDPPQDPSTFVHRVGRTARMGRAGKALVMLLPHETPYIDFLRLRKACFSLLTYKPNHKVPMKEAPPPAEGSGKAHLLFRQLSEQDRDVMDKGVKAFVSHIRAYKEHQCRFIFRLADMDLAQLATAFGLLQLPKMPELKKARQRAQSFQASQVPPQSVKFKNKAREKQRQLTLKQRDASGSKPGRAAAPASCPQQPAQKKLPAAKRRRIESQVDDAAVVEDYRQLKKLKHGRITQHEFNCRIGISSESEGDGP
ncbi:hypothetical protein ABBQ38_010952 [Trebouxia sp. C0009 RCD-2024]